MVRAHQQRSCAASASEKKPTGITPSASSCDCRLDIRCHRDVPHFSAPLLASPLLFSQMVEHRLVRKAMHHHQPHDASAFGTFERLHRVALDHRRYGDSGSFNVTKTAYVSAHV